MRKFLQIVATLAVAAALTSCYYSHPNKLDHWMPSDDATIDSVNFRIAHHYWKGFNLETTDPLVLAAHPAPQQTDALAELRVETAADSIGIRRKERLIVTDILYVPTDTVDTVWVKVARDQLTQGWLRETELLEHAVADTPISKFIHAFSDRRTIIFVSVLGVVALLLTLHLVRRRREKRDTEGNPLQRLRNWLGISSGLLMAPDGWKGAYRSFYPTLLCLTVSGITALYCSMQTFVPSTWVEYYFHPTLNPFTPELPLIMKSFVFCVWLLVIVTLAVLIDLWKQEGVTMALVHTGGLACISIIIYLVLTFTIPLYIGYVLLAAYWIYALVRYFRLRPKTFYCGYCGRSIQQLGPCPHCGAENK